jgi:serine/threonine protein kinase
LSTNKQDSLSHERSIIHRDLKPDNILLDETRCIAKTIDFGMFRQLLRLDESTYTGGLVTQWYRSPEIMLGDKNYGPAVDMWSIGCILVEMIMLCPAFACNSEIECLMVIFQRFGTPDERTYPGIAALPNYTVHFPQWHKPASLFYALRVHVSSPYYGDSKVLDLVCSLMSIDPRERISAQDCIDAHSYLEYDLDLGSAFLTPDEEGEAQHPSPGHGKSDSPQSAAAPRQRKNAHH